FFPADSITMRVHRCTSAGNTTQHHNSRAIVQNHSSYGYRAVRATWKESKNQTTTPAATMGGNWGEPVLISGGGIAGLATALALSKVGIPVRVFESAQGLRQEGAAVSLWPNAWRALEALGLAEELRSSHQLLRRVEICSSEGKLLRAFDLAECDVGPQGSETRGLLRATLLQALYERLPDRECVVEFAKSVREVLLTSEGDAAGQGPVAVRLSDGRTVYGSVLIGSDGVGSEVARYLKLSPPRFSGYCAYRGVANFPDLDPDGVSGSGSGCGPGDLRCDTIRQIWGAGVRAGLYPLTRTSFYWFTCFNADNRAAIQPPASAEGRQLAALASVREWSSALGIQAAIAATPPEDISWSRICDRWTLGAFGKSVVTLAGDAAHPMTPNLGQGGCTALEDAVVLARRLGALAQAAVSTPPSSTDVANTLRSYEYERTSRCLPLTVRANLMGVALQVPLLPVVAARNAFMERAFSSGHFLDHTTYDCGRLDDL
ncbi:hypothetical protein VaNZ11_014135, partial [Volvox africanus]